jgi:hypothetical protein
MHKLKPRPLLQLNWVCPSSTSLQRGEALESIHAFNSTIN